MSGRPNVITTWILGIKGRELYPEIGQVWLSLLQATKQLYATLILDLLCRYETGKLGVSHLSQRILQGYVVLMP